MTQPTETRTVARRSLNIDAVLSVVETVAFIVAVILAIWFNKSDAIISALIGASAHAVTHRSGGSPL